MKSMIRKFSIKIISIAALFSVCKIYGQTELKLNAAFLPLTMANVAIEKSLNDKFSIQAEAFISPWKSLYGKNMQFYMGTLEGRYYFDQVMKKWYVGAYGSLTAFNIQKWNYLRASPVYDSEGNPQILPDGSARVTERYQKGFGLIIGISGGYHFTISEKLGIDIYAGIGTVQSFYKGYYKDTGARYDDAKDWNKSGEIIPTRGGIMVTYKLN